MFKLLKLLIWVLLTLVLLIGLDQALLRLPLEAPGLSQVQQFYGDFRQRLLTLAGLSSSPPRSIEQLIESGGPSPAATQKKSPRYLYVDDAGALQFADSLEQVPPRYRKDAQPLAD